MARCGFVYGAWDAAAVRLEKTGLDISFKGYDPNLCIPNTNILLNSCPDSVWHFSFFFLGKGDNKSDQG